MYKYKPQNDDVQCKKNDSVFWCYSKIKKNTQTHTSYQELTNYGPWAKSEWPPLYEIKFYWKTAIAIHLQFVYGERWEVREREFMTHKAQNIYYIAL